MQLHQLIPAVLTCLVGKRLCENPAENHWALRDFCAGLIAFICNRYGREYATIQPRITKTLAQAYMDPKRPLTTHYGAIVGFVLASIVPPHTRLTISKCSLSRISSHTRQLVVLPHLPQYMELLKEALNSDNVIKRSEALMCHSALLVSFSTFHISSGYSHALFNFTVSSWSIFVRNFKISTESCCSRSSSYKYSVLSVV